MHNDTRVLPQGGIIIPPGVGFPHQGPGPVIPPWIIPGFLGPVKPPTPKPHQENKERLTVNIKSVFTDEYVVVGYNNFLEATGRQVKKNGIFRLIMQDDNQVKIRIPDGNFIRVDNRDFLVTDTDNRGATKFSMFKLYDKEYVFLAPNGYYVRVEDRDKMLVARAENPGPRTIFKFKEVEQY